MDAAPILNCNVICMSQSMGAALPDKCENSEGRDD